MALLPESKNKTLERMLNTITPDELARMRAYVAALPESSDRVMLLDLIAKCEAYKAIHFSVQLSLF